MFLWQCTMRYKILIFTTWSIFQSEALFAAPLTFNTGLPVSKGEYILREQLVMNKSSDDPSTANRDRTELNVVSTLVYGVTPDFALFASIPYTDRRLKTINTRSARGLGDTKLFGRYTLYKENFKGGTFRIAPFVGVELPTGEDNKRDGLGMLPLSVQPGSGSWDIFEGVVATYGTVNWEIDGQMSYQHNNEANNVEVGDIARADGSLQYRLFPQTLSSDTDYFINGILEINLINKDKNRLMGADNSNSGGTTVFLVPGMQYITQRWIAELGVQIPVVQNLNGTALKNDYIVRTGFRINF